jgi:phage terminase small subunit
MVEPETSFGSELDLAEIAERAARLGVTPERVLQEYARIAFADLRRVADWGPDGLVLKTPEALSDADAAAISEITEAGAGSGNYRVKLYDKKGALDAIARHLGMFVRAPRRQEDGALADLAEDAREMLARRLARLAAGGSEK